MSELGVLVVDDEHLARRGLIMRLANIPNVRVLGECANGNQALQAIAEQQPDLVFLDIQMPGMSGLELVSKLQGDNLPMVVFVTAYNEFAVDAFKINAIDYVLKPLEESRVREAVERAQTVRENREASQEKARLLDLVHSLEDRAAQEILEAPSRDLPTAPDRLVIRDGAEVHLVPMDDIDWIEAAGDYMCVHAGQQTHVIRSTLKHLLEQLDEARFARIHRSTVVNLGRVSSAQSLSSGEYRLTLLGGAQLKVSRGYRDAVKNLLGKTA